jgi:anti-sigma B factor antagonist
MFGKSLQITVELGAREGTRILHLNGPLDMETTLEFQRVVRAESSPVLIVDFGGVPYMDSAGIGAIVGAYVSARKAQRRIALTGMNERLASVGRAKSSQQDPCNVH